MRLSKWILLAACGALSFLPSHAQQITKYSFGDGIRLLAADSSFSMKFSARFQSLYAGTLNTGNNEYKDEFQIRRARLKFDGFAYNPKLTYKFELAVANADITAGAIDQAGNTASIVLDACLKWNFAGNWSLWFGQTKLPGNRERVISSQELQFVDRSNVNAMFNLDRDIGIQLHYEGKTLNLAGALSMGEGRNIIVENAGGYSYTVRAEYLPFGKFTDGGDYSGSDLSREPEPRLSVGTAYNINDGATRTHGQLGEFVHAQRDLSTWFVDAHFKYKGISSLLEYARRTTPGNALVFDEQDNLVDALYTGEGLSWQAGYLFDNNVEIAARYTYVDPENEMVHPRSEQYTLGASWYIVGHSLKIQSDISLLQEEQTADAVMYRLQMELAF